MKCGMQILKSNDTLFLEGWNIQHIYVSQPTRDAYQQMLAPIIVAALIEQVSPSPMCGAYHTAI